MPAQEKGLGSGCWVRPKNVEGREMEDRLKTTTSMRFQCLRAMMVHDDGDKVF